MADRSVLGTIEVYENAEQHLEFHDGPTYRLMDALLAPYGYFLVPTRASVGDKTVAVLKRGRTD